MNTLVILILNLVFFIVNLVLIYFILRFVVHSIKKTIAKSELDTTAILIGLGTSLIIFPLTIKVFLQNLAWFTVQFISYPFNLLNNYNPNDPSGFKSLVYNMFQEFTKLIEKFFSQLSFANLILFFIVWILISLYVKKITVGNNSTNLELRVIRKNFLSICVLLFAAYLSITAIISIPIVNYKSELNKDKVLVEFESDLEKNPIDYDNIYLDPALISKHKTIDSTHTKLIREYITLQENYIMTIDLSKRQVENKKLLATLLLKEAFLKKINDKTTLHYKGMLTSWYINYVEDVIRVLDKNKHELLTFESDTSVAILDDSFESMMKYLNNYYNEIAKDELSNSYPPNIPKPGDNFGLFGIIAGWLINTEDIAFVLIIGLLGFGLLGAAGSELIKGVKNLDSNKILISNLNGAIVKGSSAALIVFLAVKGGMAILATNESENINPYALFFICFISSVYSTDVWEWAKTKLLEKIEINTDLKEKENPDK